MQNVADYVKTDKHVVKNFSGALLQLKSKISEQMEDDQFYGAYSQTNSDQKDDLVIFNDLCNGAKVSVF